jgi:dienelactone hydrolase
VTRRLAAAVLLALAVAGLAACGGGSKHSAGTTTTAAQAPERLTFGYDASKPLDRIDRGIVARRGSITFHDVGFVSNGEHVDAYVVEPAGRARRPAVVLVHGSGGDRSELLGGALALARRGIVAMTITAPSSARPPAATSSPRVRIAQARSVTVRDVVAVRRAADVLASLPNVDPRRIGYLGWSNGAKTGAFVAAADRRFRALVLLSGGADTLADFVAAAPAGLRPLVRRQLGLVDPLRYLPHAARGSVLLLDGTRDDVVPRRALRNMIRAAPPGTVVHWYPAGHALDLTAYRAAYAWLVAKLGAKA